MLGAGIRLEDSREYLALFTENIDSFGLNVFI